MARVLTHIARKQFMAAVLRYRRVPHELRQGPGSFHPLADTIKLLTKHARKGLEFPVVALVGAGRMPGEGQDEADESRLFYVAATRATQRLIIPVCGSGRLGARLTQPAA